ncbi:hypothetical protein K488DRAFT_51292 [Vararia minispora EC-137]|uniref:Uncharacterized protein n=1 Tax=Vararia minispora EC-137 TaxID=1314806 RepID=A0ACB8QJ76_9AGAM|nr:hypothetical protein K488DRAFT_51292 [Vararia minispora EC-137]
MKAVLVASALASVALAQSTSPLIPTGISASCTTFLGQLNSDTSMSSCLTSITSATSAFGPTANSTATSSDVSSALSQLCASTACSDSTLRAQLASFYSACTSELVGSPNAEVLTQYDALYALSPMKNALCTKSNGTYCVSTIASSTSSTSRKRAQQAVLKPSASTFASSNIPFLRLSASLPSSALCSPCSRSIQQAWISGMNAAAYAPGIANSVLLSGWSALYNGTLATCGSSFLDTTGTNNAGTNGALGSGVLGGSTSAGSEQAPANVLGMLGALALAALAF